MSEFDDRFAALTTPALATAFGDGDAVTLPTTTSKTSTLLVDAIVGGEEVEKGTDNEGRLEERTVRSVIVQTADLARASVRKNGTATIGSKTYAITHVGPEVGAAYEIVLKAVNRSEIARDNYRTRR